MHVPETLEGGAPGPERTAWAAVLLAIAAGVLGAAQLGKVHIGLPSIRSSFSLGLFSASWILSALNVVGLFAATPAGTLCARMGNRRAVIAGLATIAAASASGGFSPGLAWLLGTRLVEGVGFVMIVVAAPSLIVEVTSGKDLRIVLAGWSAYMPAGIALAAALAPLVLAHHTWRAVWEIDAAVLLALGALFLFVPGESAAMRGRPARASLGKEFRTVVTARGPLLLALIFGMFTLQYLSIMGFLPTLLMERFHLSGEETGLLVSIATASNILGNLAAGVLLQRGASRGGMIAWTSFFMIAMTVAMFSAPLPLGAFYLCALAFSCVGGLIPSSVMGAAPYFSPAPSMIGATNGLLVQGSNLGIVLGPPMVSMIATRWGWNFVPVVTGLAALLAAGMAWRLQPSRGEEEPAGVGGGTEEVR